MIAKRTLDIVGGGLAIALFSPVLIAAAVAVKVSSPGPVFFIQERIGLKGKTFSMIKFRSMVQGSEHKGTGLFSFEGDPRITSVGHFLRKTSLDELPQLFNVLQGSMSLVGPRPPVTYELGPWDEYSDEMKRRFDVKPGITGLAQVSGRNDLDWDEKIVFDNQYVALLERKGVLVDIKLLLKTIGVVLRSNSVNEDQSKVESSSGEIARRAKSSNLPENSDRKSNESV